MKDPFPLPALPALSRAVEPLAEWASLPTLPAHVHEVLFAFAFYTGINFVASPWLSRRYFGKHYNAMSRVKRLNWDVHVVSLVQSTLINVLALWAMAVDGERKAMDLTARIWGYTGASGLIQAFALGYFLWDLLITAMYIDVFGLGMLAHAVSAVLVYSLGFRPFLNYYASVFILWELSSPFLNIHWFCDKMGMTGSRLQLYNGLTLIATFFSCRLVWGTFQSGRVYLDMWSVVGTHPSTNATTTTSNLYFGATGLARLNKLSAADELMVFANDESTVPIWLAVSYVGANLTLNTLNFYWFVKMIQAVMKRFTPEAKEKKDKADGAKAAPPVALNERLDLTTPPTDEGLRKRNALIDIDEAPPAVS